MKLAKIDNLKLMIHVPVVYALGLKVGKVLPLPVLLQSILSVDRGEAAVITAEAIESGSPDTVFSRETLRTRLVLDNRKGQLPIRSHALAFRQF